MSEFPELSQALDFLLRVTSAEPSGAPDRDELISKLMAYMEGEDSRRERAYTAFEEQLHRLSAALPDFLSQCDERKELHRATAVNAEKIAAAVHADEINELASDLAAVSSQVEELRQSLAEALGAVTSLLNSRMIKVGGLVTPRPKQVIQGAGYALAIGLQKLSEVDRGIRAIMEKLSVAKPPADQKDHA
jgi:ABC-type transporter Mla subunit MlaD